jgi:hypothetical protein
MHLFTNKSIRTMTMPLVFTPGGGATVKECRLPEREIQLVLLLKT